VQTGDLDQPFVSENGKWANEIVFVERRVTLSPFVM
jgi:hypothetical protein